MAASSSAAEEEGLEKASAARQFFEDFYSATGSYVVGRINRYTELQNRIDSGELSGAAAEAARDEFALAERRFLRQRRKRIKLHDFDLIKMVGKGGYGEVYLVRKKDTTEVLALKKMKKSAILKSQTEITHLRTERNVLANQQSRWLVQMVYSFQDAANVYMAMEFVHGGDVRTRLTAVDTLSEADARFYIAEMFLSVDALHQAGYIHRDLKPENFLIDSNGHIKLTDFGLSKGNMLTIQSQTMKRGMLPSSKDGDRRSIGARKRVFGSIKRNARELAFSLVGSPDYMAVEMLRGEGYDFSVDYWALAAILFEMIVGFAPFADDDIEAVFRNIFNHEVTLNFPDIYTYMSHEAWDLITSILKEPADRLGKGGISEIKSHQFFDSIAWKALGTESGPSPPWVPELSDDTDTRYFDVYEEDPNAVAAEDAADADAKFQAFPAFTFKRRRPDASS
ncbi:AGC/NDR protein kinase [Thecamonas trahens ATCC 50062]|uniref:non-specific serine/threonine protein kinase n=1 Tax=Thecamonas trahens ATCC 50062 TaxID=461836 RepID=A0A0L0DVB7_THETB|nr:AGC/NDR protein kinase [Thecamonas trahens ATCC 50062]KNC56097.1 AGC/NDR protein kinase [Thecamonas trahens ATCC 50062]|eukprot:XP_013761139.1 AGC/NDR protein kinase [Thecamonas trahens ATCC 50062]